MQTSKIQNKCKFPNTLKCFKYIIDPPEDFITMLTSILKSEQSTPRAPSLRWDLSHEAALHNMTLIQEHGNNIQNYLEKNEDTFISFGSEFRPPDTLEPLLCRHPNWQRFKLLLQKGSSWPLEDLPESDRLAKNEEFIMRGNHKSAKKYNSKLEKILTQELRQGWMFPLPLEYVQQLKHGELAPVGIEDSQWSELPDGSRKQKFRLTHDQSFEATRGRSVNTRVQREKLEPLHYGGCLSRLIHYVVSLRARHPNVKILGGKSDFKGAYRRVHVHGDIAAMCTIMFKSFCLPSLRLTFGGSPCPNEFCVVSELCTDLANDILHCPHWNPNDLKSPHTSILLDPVTLDDSIPYHQARDLDVDIPLDDCGRIDDFIDDGIAIIPDIGQNRHRAVQAMLLAIHTICRPLDKNEKILREDCVSLGKLEEEGTLSEEPTILGWKLNTRLLTIALPMKKAKYWLEDLNKTILSKKISFKKLETIVGRLNHAATACPLMRYFLNRIRNTLTNWSRASVRKESVRYLSTMVIEDMKLWRDDFLPKITRGISLNLVTFRRPSFVCWSDACPQGLGGYDFMGRAWRFPIPEEFRSAVLYQNNSLEFLASLVSVWVAISKNYAESEMCFLALGDNSSAVGWLHKANVDDTKNYPLHIAARKYGEILLQADCCVYGQHIRGIYNNVADALSRKSELSDKDLTSYILSNFSSQVPNYLTISPLPQEISSWVIFWLRKCKERMGLQSTQEIKRSECGDDGWNIPDSSTSIMTSGSRASHLTAELNSWGPSQQHFDDGNFLSLTRETWQREQCKRPWQNWVRSLGQTWGTTPHMAMDLVDSTPACSDNSRE